MNERIELLDDLGAEIARVASEAERASPGPSRLAGRLLPMGPRARTVAVALTAALLLAGGTYAVPATRAAADGIAGSLAAWVSGGGGEDPPGRAVEARDGLPERLGEGGEARVIAKTGDLVLYARRVDDPEQKTEDGPYLEFLLGTAMAWGASLERWRERLDRHTVFLLGHTPFGARDILDGRGRVPLFGLTTPDVERVELRYSHGPPLERRTGDGGFILLVDAWRPLRELVAYDAAGRALDRTDVSHLDLSYLCEKEPACPPGTF